MICSAICHATGKKCTNNAKYKTSEDLNVCKVHIDFKLKDIERIKQKIEEKQKRDQMKKENAIINEDLIKKHPGEIPLRNKDGLIIDFALVSPEDYEDVMKYKWHKTDKGYARYTIDDNPILMHQYILGKPENKDHMIDHINHKRLDNRRENLIFNTGSGNGQNREKNDDNSSKYLGVSWYLRNKKWVAQSGGKFLGYFSNEKDAAIKYDTYVLLKYGKNSSTNKLVKFDEIKNIDINSLFNDKNKRILPNNISLKKNLYEVKIMYKTVIYRSYSKTLENAENKLQEFKGIIQKIKDDDLKEHINKPITRNQKGQPILIIRNKKGEQIDETIVDENKWHELSLYTWIKAGNYYSAIINGKKIQLNRYLTGAKKGEIADHINNSGNDVSINTIENLRINDVTGNNHNKSKNKNASSKFYGVSYAISKNKWCSSIKKDIRYYLGCYKLEIQAAVAYNIRAKELYDELANLNDIPEADFNKYYKEVYDNIKRLEK